MEGEKKRYSFCRFEHVFSSSNIVLPRRCFVLFLSACPWGKIPFYPRQTLPFSNSRKTTNFLFRLNGVFSTHLLSRRKGRYSTAIVFPHAQASRVSEGNVFASSTRVEPCSGTSRHEQREKEILANSTTEKTNKQHKTDKKKKLPNSLPSRIRPEDL